MTAETISELRDFEGKVAVITGGSQGIGKAVADELIQRGAKVVIGDISEELGNSVVDEYNKLAGMKVAAFIRTDVTTYVDNKALFQLAETEFGGVDIAVLNAGIAKNSNTFFTPLEDDMEELIFKVNTLGVIKGSKVALMHMAKRGWRIDLTCSDLSAYNASKHAVVGYVRSCNLLPAVCNVRVNAVCPTWVETDLLKNLSSGNNFNDIFLETVDSLPRAKMCDVVKGVFTFLSEESRNAETLMVLSEGLKLNVPPKLPDGYLNENSLAAQKKYYENIIPSTKKQLAEALERYESEKQTL